MPEYSAHYHLTKLRPGENLSVDDYAITRRNIDKIDNLLYLGAEAHRHTGEGPLVSNPDQPLQLTLVTGAGAIPAGRTLRYKYAWVDQYGNETAASPEAVITTPSPISTPGRLTLTAASLGGTLMPGNYFYAVSAYKDQNTLETLASERAYTTLLAGGSNVVALGLPTLPSQATGFNVYRRRPGSSRYQYLTSVDMSVSTPPTTFYDTGSIEEDCNRTVPVVNTTGGANSVVVSLSGATPAVPAGFTWKLYRTYTLNGWDSSMLQWVVEQTSEGSGIVTTVVTDTGGSTSLGSPQTFSEIPGSPPKVDLTDGREVTGSLPAGQNVVPFVHTFTLEGPVQVGMHKMVWPFEFSKGRLVGCRAVLGRDSAPASQDVIVDVHIKPVALGSWVSTYNGSPSSRPTIPVGEQLSTRTTPEWETIETGDLFCVEVVQDGGGATPTDTDLSVTLYFLVRGGSATVSETFAP